MHLDLTSMNPQTKVLSHTNDLVFSQKMFFPMTRPHISKIVLSCGIKKKNQLFCQSLFYLFAKNGQKEKTDGIIEKTNIFDTVMQREKKKFPF